MSERRVSFWGPEFERIRGGGLASSTEERLAELLGWGGSTSFLSPRDLSVAADVEVHPLAQVVGLSGGVMLTGYVRTTRPGQGRMRLGTARWREHSGPVRTWARLRERALARLVEQARRLQADAVIGVTAQRATGPEEGHAELSFTGTAVRVAAWRRRPRAPVLTLASAQELWLMLRAGVEPVGIAGGFARVETLPSRQTVRASLGRRSAPNIELADLTAAVYEVRHLALTRVVAEAQGLGADGLIGVDLRMEGAEPGRTNPAPTLSVHVLASAIRRVAAPELSPQVVLSISDGHG